MLIENKRKFFFGGSVISYLAPRQHGKTTKILEVALEHTSKECCVLTFSHQNAKFVRDTFERLLSDRRIDYTNPRKGLYCLKGKSVFIDPIDTFIASQTKSFNVYGNCDVFIDELPLCIDRLIPNLQMFTGTTERIGVEPPEWIDDEWYERMKCNMSEDTYRKEILAEYKGKNEK